MGFLQLLENVITHIQGTQQRHEKLGKTIKEKSMNPILMNGGKGVGENTLTLPIRKIQLSGKMGGVDSGFVAQSFYSLDLMMLRTCGVCFTYENGKMIKTNYFPETFSLPEPIVNTTGLEREEFHKFVSLTRVQAELESARELIEKAKPDVFFIDGSLILHPLDKPGSDSKLKNEYHKTILAFTTLYKTAEKNNCILIGAVEDSRSTRLSEWIHANMLNENGATNVLHDAPLLDKVLGAGQRSCAFTFAESGERHPILMDFPTEWGDKIHACYIKPSQWDYPLRIEFLSNGKNLTDDANRAAELACAQSAIHKEYAFPSVLIEADMRAGLKQEEVELVSDKIFSKLGRNAIRARRRDRRPF